MSPSFVHEPSLFPLGKDDLKTGVGEVRGEGWIGEVHKCYCQGNARIRKERRKRCEAVWPPKLSKEHAVNQRNLRGGLLELVVDANYAT